PREREFLSVSRRTAQRRQRIRNLVLVAIPLGLLSVYAIAHYQTQREVALRLRRDIERGQAELTIGREKNGQVEALYTKAYTLFDSQRLPEGEIVYAKAQELAVETDRTFGRASQFFEAAVTTDNTNVEARDLLGDALYARAVMAERDRRT